MALVLLDLDAAFYNMKLDSVINTLEQHTGVKGVALSWFRNYLNKENQIRTAMTVSNPATSSKGSPQGSVLGPVLLTTYTIPLAAICKRHGSNITCMQMTPCSISRLIHPCNGIVFFLNVFKKLEHGCTFTN